MEQFERFVYPNLKSAAVRKWIHDKFINGKLKLSSVTIEIAELRSGVSKLHAKVADYHDIAGNKVKFKAITNGIDLEKWMMPEILEFCRESEIIDEQGLPTANYIENLSSFTAQKIRNFKRAGRHILNDVLVGRPDQNGNILHFKDDDFIFDFKRRFVDYKRPDLPFRNLAKLRQILESRNAHYILAGRVHTGDETMSRKLHRLLEDVRKDEYLDTHVHYIADYDERLAYGLSCGSNVAINVPIVGLEACGTSWMKDIANLNLLISTHDGGVADASTESYLNVQGGSEDEELEALYQRMEEALNTADSDFDLEFMVQKQLAAYLPVISGARMLKEYIDYLFSK